MGLKVDLRIGESLRLDDGRVTITLLEKSGQRARVSVEADESVAIQLPQHDSKPPACGGGKKMVAGAV